MNKVCSFFMVIGLAAALHVNAQGGGFLNPEENIRPESNLQEHAGSNGDETTGYMMPYQEAGIIANDDDSRTPSLNGNGMPFQRDRMMPRPHDGMMLPPHHRENEERTIVENQFCINSGTIQFKDVLFTLNNNELMRVKRDKRKNKKGNGHLQLSGTQGFTYEGNVYIDKKCEGSVTVDKGVIWTGYANRNKRSKKVTITVNGTWNLTDDSYISRLVIGRDAMVNTNGHKLKYKSLENLGVLN